MPCLLRIFVLGLRSLVACARATGFCKNKAHTRSVRVAPAVRRARRAESAGEAAADDDDSSLTSGDDEGARRPANSGGDKLREGPPAGSQVIPVVPATRARDFRGHGSIFSFV